MQTCIEKNHNVSKSNLQRLPYCFVTFKFPEEYQAFLTQYETAFYERIFCFSDLKYENTPIYVNAAPETYEYLWHNLDADSNFCGFMYSVGYMILLIGIPALICWGFAEAIANLRSDLTKNKSTMNFLTFLIVIVITTVNKIMVETIPWFTHNFEKYTTLSNSHKSTLYKLLFGLFINTSVVPLLIFRKTAYFVDNGLLDTVFALWISICFVQPIIEIFNPSYLEKIIKRWILWVKGRYLDMTQYEAIIWQLAPSANIDRTYAYYFNLFNFTAFFIYIFPLGGVISIGAAIIHYFVEKGLLVWRFKRPHKIPTQVGVFSMNFLFFPFILLLAGHYVFEVILANDGDELKAHMYSIIPIIIYILFIMVLLIYLMWARRNNRLGQFSKILYTLAGTDNIIHEYFNERYNGLKFDYRIRDRYKLANPVTSDAAQMEILQETLKNLKKNDPASEKITKVLQELNSRGEFITPHIQNLAHRLDHSEGCELVAPVPVPNFIQEFVPKDTPPKLPIEEIEGEGAAPVTLDRLNPNGSQPSIKVIPAGMKGSAADTFTGLNVHAFGLESVNSAYVFLFNVIC